MNSESFNNNVFQVNNFSDWVLKFNEIKSKSSYNLFTDEKLLQILYNENYLPCEAINYFYLFISNLS